MRSATVRWELCAHLQSSSARNPEPQTLRGLYVLRKAEAACSHVMFFCSEGVALQVCGEDVAEGEGDDAGTPQTFSDIIRTTSTMIRIIILRIRIIISYND